MTSSHSTDGSMTVVAAGPVLQLHGTLDPAALETALARFVARQRDLHTWRIGTDSAEHAEHPEAEGVLRARLERHGPAHHTLRLTVQPAGEPARPGQDLPAGLLADLLAGPAGPVPLSPCQRDILRAAPGDTARAHHGVLLRLPGPVDGDTLRRALRSVVAAHPMLSARIVPAPGERMLLTAEMAREAGRYDPLRTAEFTDRAAFDQAVAETRRGLDPHAGVLLRALHARGGGAGFPAGDLLFLAVHDLAADTASWPVLLEDLERALDALTAGTPPRLTSDAGRFEEWTERLRAMTADADEAAHRRGAAGDRSAAGPRPPASGPDGPQVRHTRFALPVTETSMLTGVLPARYGLSVAELLAGAVGQALARWRGTHDLAFDLRTDGRDGLPGYARAVGPYTRVRRIRLDSNRHLTPDRYLAAVAPALTGDADPAPPGGPRAAACFTHHPSAELLPGSSRFTLAGPAPSRLPQPAGGASPYGVQVRSHIEHGRLHVQAEWCPGAADGVDETSVDALCGRLRSVLESLADSGADDTPVPSAGPTVAATPRQRELLAQSPAHPGAGHHVEQLHWTWHGPLDSERFTAAWQAVFERETLLRAAFDRHDHSRIVLHDRATAQVVRLAHTDMSWARLRERDRRRGIDLYRPGALRVTLLDGPPGDGEAADTTRVLLTYHHALVDTWSVRVLLREFYRAYLHDGSLGGGERRPDLRDYTSWLGDQDPSPARDFWSRAAARPGTALQPARPGAPTRLTGFGRTSRRLPQPEAARLVHWAASWGVTESTAVQAAWALLLHRATGATGPTTVTFGVSVDGRGIPLEGVERLPGPLSGVLPMTVDVDPAATVPRLLAALRDRTLDMAAHDWIGAEHIRAWSGRPADEALFGTAVDFEPRKPPPDDLVAQLAARGVRVDPPQSTGATSTLPVRLVVRYDHLGGLLLTAVHDRGRLADAEAAKILAQSRQLLRAFVDGADATRPVAEVLNALPGADVPRMAAEPGPDRGVLTELRRAERPDAGAVCLVPPPGATPAGYRALVASHTGPEQLLAVRSATEAPDRAARELRTACALGHRLVLAGWSGSGRLAHEIARRVGSDDGTCPLVVTQGAGPADADGLAHTLSHLGSGPDEEVRPDDRGPGPSSVEHLSKDS
ncbi:condensation domain-containing protein [Streptomyces piniterrae]|nr:condensation domain-containing protein [Streptomyces piniterrae]